MNLDKKTKQWIKELRRESKDDQDNWEIDRILDFLEDEKPISKSSNIVRVLRSMNPREKLALRTKIDKYLDRASRTSGEAGYEMIAYGMGAVAALEHEDYTCPLIHYVLSPLDIQDSLTRRQYERKK